ncbi:TPA: hypothetical protein DCL28_01400 [Candidatus Komeilibacteria bacterium]|nr:MAG: hypothetical protein UW91_C0042G0002 [Parcubacteria group bacterium GW2011_GWF2_45_11]OGY93762.1 MAG: hypothetical protein A3J95_02530 [Candidatus Komeilibacteria bacterium RIFOXYC2_FULL_45_12]HAH04196.1 hypothetical protein [Candidatus Komeilibacteria bacterium]HBR13103.1 hypothetical protein [Candidatus Komeilibacteria bacterium]HBV02324.1 hypothetical protein [Candidatus Komeilibacteria bacterium]
MPINNKNLNFWRIITNTWGILTLTLFVVDFFSFHSYSEATSASAVIYGFILAMFVGSKEFQRWKSKNGQYRSIHWGEIYPIVWSIIMLLFVFITAISKNDFQIPNEFPATYITVLGIYIISQQSKSFYSKK